ncbi:MAG TPA: hypothetical protein VMS08_02285 [Candidatus Saccharimonadia bacterium]|jgi:hypothetical protein|nr:hypothetical protein [Candidatus Saccharimonadia bacterium]
MAQELNGEARGRYLNAMGAPWVPDCEGLITRDPFSLTVMSRVYIALAALAPRFGENGEFWFASSEGESGCPLEMTCPRELVVVFNRKTCKWGDCPFDMGNRYPLGAVIYQRGNPRSEQAMGVLLERMPVGLGPVRHAALLMPPSGFRLGTWYVDPRVSTLLPAQMRGTCPSFAWLPRDGWEGVDQADLEEALPLLARHIAN